MLAILKAEMPEESFVTTAMTGPKSNETERKASDSAPRFYLEYDLDILLTNMVFYSSVVATSIQVSASHTHNDDLTSRKGYARTRGALRF